MKTPCGIIFVGALLALSFLRAADAPPKIEFNRDIRPILSDHCFACHGPDKNRRKSGLRLDDPEQPFQPSKSGETAIVRGQPERSELVKRIFNKDNDELMPPPEFHKPISAEQKELLKKWIEQGAPFQAHWSFIPPVKAAIPAGENGVDECVRQRLTRLGIASSPEADRRTLARRVYFDLLGLPPRPQDVDAFMNDNSPGAYEKLVDRLLANPHFGERMAQGWLDVVRFADTIGYHSDNPRNIYPYRDYVIAAFNANKPFDQFTLEQIAGDLLPGSTLEAKIGSAFNRLVMSTEEGGAQPKDYEARMLTDRVRAIGTAWLGQTTGCAQCHDHKFDPFTTRDFYALGAFFADIKEPLVGAREQGLLLDADQKKRLDEIDGRLAELKKKFDEPRPELAGAQHAWEKAAADALSTPGAQKPASVPGEPPLSKAIVEILKLDAAKRSAPQKAKLVAHYKQIAPELADARAAMAAVEKEKKELELSVPKCLVSVALETPRTVRILPRGNWMDESGEIVQPALPHYLPQPKAGARRLTRLDLAQWLVSRENPLTARAFVNRLWKQFFGIGISRMTEDLGAQGEPPVNPALLDWLACEFMDSGWDIKHLVRTIVTSRVYRQSSLATKEMLARDPNNRELARQSRFRLDAESVRDNALSIAGLLVEKIGGPSVKPYQPEGYWENLNFPTRTYTADSGENQYRRGLYTWWQRSFLHPSLLAFDAPSREECCAERNRSNIPQQALALLNDPTYVEAARAFAARILTEGGAPVDARIGWAWRQALQRAPREDELNTAHDLFEKHFSEFSKDEKATDACLKTGFAPVPKGLNKAELAAWTNVARVILNLHETITRN